MRENFILQTLHRGFDRAAKAFSTMIHAPVSLAPNPMSLEPVRHDKLMFDASDRHVFITHLIGELAGRSYLILDQAACEAIFGAVRSARGNIQDTLQYPLLMELDNILSAAVISELSNALSVEVYGDVPAHRWVRAAEAKAYWDEEFKPDDDTHTIFYSTVTFYCGQTHAPAPFVWKFNTRLLDQIPEGRIAV